MVDNVKIECAYIIDTSCYYNGVPLFKIGKSSFSKQELENKKDFDKLIIARMGDCQSFCPDPKFLVVFPCQLDTTTFGNYGYELENDFKLLFQPFLIKRELYRGTSECIEKINTLQSLVGLINPKGKTERHFYNFTVLRRGFSKLVNGGLKWKPLVHKNFPGIIKYEIEPDILAIRSATSKKIKAYDQLGYIQFENPSPTQQKLRLNHLELENIAKEMSKT